MKQQQWLVVLGGVVAIIGQFWGADYYLPLIGGALTLIGALFVKK